MKEINRIFCIGRNYVKHIEELNNQQPASPVIFMKPATSVVRSGGSIQYPSHGSDLHHEIELVLQIGREGRPQTELEAREFIAAFTLGVDLTLRDVQSRMKEKGLPWEIAKAFDGSAMLGDFVPVHVGTNLNDYDFELEVNGEIRQKGYTNRMIFSVEKLVLALAKIWKLLPGDIIFTGTPEGVGPLFKGDKLIARGKNIGPFSWTIKN